MINCFRSEDIVISSNINYIELTCRSNIRCNEDTMSCGTLRTITRNRTHCKILFTYTLGNKCGRTTAVTVSSPLTTECKHSLAFFVITEANRVICTTSIVHTYNKSTIFFNANHGTCSGIRGTLFFCLYKGTIFNNHSK